MLEPPPKLDAIVNAVIGAAFEVDRILGPGFLERVYEEALAVELKLRGISFERQQAINVSYKGQLIGEGRADFIVGSSLIVELKAVDRLLPLHQAQVISYLKAAKYRLGLLINFREALLRDGVKRVIFTTPD